MEKKRENARIWRINRDRRERERDFSRRGDERRVGNSGLERDKERKKGGEKERIQRLNTKMK